ncbi:hypothetical protein P4E94_14315 [Pontiellaceae bacterium B12219]|nr:hypothetical protein [Pontiellaceae bacterium B12219]
MKKTLHLYVISLLLVTSVFMLVGCDAEKKQTSAPAAPAPAPKPVPESQKKPEDIPETPKPIAEQSEKESAQADPTLLPLNRKNFSYAYWLNGWRKNKNDDSPEILCFETGYYGLTFDLSDFSKTRFSLLNDDSSYMEALKTGNQRINRLEPANLIIEAVVDGTPYRAVACEAGVSKNQKRLQNARLWESGQLVQHFDLMGLIFKDASGRELECDGILDLVIWPDTITLTLELTPTSASWKNTKLSIRLNDWETETTVSNDWKPDEKKQLTLNCNLKDLPLKKDAVSIQFTAPQNQSFPADFDEAYACYAVKIGKRELKRSWKSGYTDIRDYDEFDIVINNEDNSTYVPFQLDLSGPANITGLCPILCHEDGTPTGIPVQLSKNWHHEGLGSYLRAYTTIPATQGVSKYKLRIVYGFYGTLPSASHSQLSLVGYGSDGARGNNGRWDQLAIGCWGETICFDMDTSCVDNIVTDVRMLMTRNGLEGKKWSWTDGGWGGDWLNLQDDRNQKLYFTELKTAYLSQGPCLTEVHYDGYYGSEREIDFKANVQTLRTDDYARTFQTFEYTFTQSVSAENGWLFKMGKTSHLVTPEIAYGNANGLIKEHNVPSGLKPGEVYQKETELTGAAPWWIAFPGATKIDGRDWGTGSRALIIRSYEAVIDGKTHTNPTISFPVFRVESEGRINLDMILTPPEGVKEFNAGDRITFEVEWITLPRVADDYYGPNETFRNHLKKFSRSWKSVYREAIGNDLEVQTAGATVKHTYPLILEATRPDDIQMKITGGVGMVPVRIEGLESAEYALYQVKGNDRIKLDQSVHGNDFWQTIYDPVSETYSLTYNLPLDGTKTSGWVLSAE